MIDDNNMKFRFYLYDAAQRIYEYLESKMEMGIIREVTSLPQAQDDPSGPKVRITGINNKFWKKVLRPEIKRCAEPFNVKFTHYHKNKERKNSYIVIEVRMP